MVVTEADYNAMTPAQQQAYASQYAAQNAPKAPQATNPIQDMAVNAAKAQAIKQGVGALGISGAPTVAPSVLGSTTLGAALPALGVPAAAYTGYQQALGAQALASGKPVSPLQHAVLLPFTGGLDTLGGLFGLGGSPGTNLEQDRWKALEAQGIKPMFAGQDDPSQKASAVDPNSVFQKTRNEADLTGQDLVGYAGLGEHYGPAWNTASMAQKLDVANQLAKAGAANEQHGTIDFDWSKVDPTLGAAPAAAAAPHQWQPGDPVHGSTPSAPSGLLGIGRGR